MTKRSCFIHGQYEGEACAQCQAALPPVRSDALLARRADVFQGRADQCSEMATWLSLNGCADSANHLRNVAAILRHTADKYRANKKSGE